ncbi:P-loop containing nucleoside triphosphate hydrolase protein [Thelephora terrestris]|uniref:P-loop containing nucleoside triphosphate hydrolase protein n=1 Tax=Thelephora terrestris TaxID=56493 RepID=A0A9P6H8M6_9AGAM|nr:P-loop containing nucleoside triphosphate hydrolase protein [Thelephora terrestris]
MSVPVPGFMMNTSRKIYDEVHSSVKNLQRSTPPSPSTSVGLRRPPPALLSSPKGRTKDRAYVAPSQGSYTPEVKILVMGATGSGKSTISPSFIKFINLVSGSGFDVGKGLRSCTNSVQVAGAFNLDGRRVVLIDTPGFNDTTQSDTEILRTIVAFLGASYEQGDTLAGILYFHRISDLRMSGTQTRNFRMFQNLCGDVALQNVVIVTNMWSRVELEVGQAREAELREDDMFFKPALSRGAKMARHEDTNSSANEIIRLLINNRPLPLQIQKELIEEHKDILETSAGQELNQELNDEIRKHQEDVRNLTEEMEQATRDKDEETRVELENETRRVREQMRRFEEEAQRLESEYRRERGQFQLELAELERERRKGYHCAEYPLQTQPYHFTPTIGLGEQIVDASGRFAEKVVSRGVASVKNLTRSVGKKLSGF